MVGDGSYLMMSLRDRHGRAGGRDASPSCWSTTTATGSIGGALALGRRRTASAPASASATASGALDGDVAARRPRRERGEPAASTRVARARVDELRDGARRSARGATHTTVVVSRDRPVGRRRRLRVAGGTCRSPRSRRWRRSRPRARPTTTRGRPCGRTWRSREGACQRAMIVARCPLDLARRASRVRSVVRRPASKREITEAPEQVPCTRRRDVSCERRPASAAVGASAPSSPVERSGSVSMLTPTPPPAPDPAAPAAGACPRATSGSRR